MFDFKSYRITLIVRLTISLLNILLHSIGVYLLVQDNGHNSDNFQSIYIKNLAITELIWNLVFFVNDAMYIDNNSHRFHWIISFMIWFSWFAYYGAMCLIVCDRLYQTISPYKYRANWTQKKARVSIAISWLISFLITICLFLPDTKSFEYLDNPILVFSVHTFYLLFSISAYIAMFVFFVRTRRRAQTNLNLSVWRIFKNSRFYFSFLLVGSYLILTVAPQLCFQVANSFNKYFRINDMSVAIALVIRQISVTLSSTVDAFLYIFAQKRVRKIFYKKLCCCWRGNDTTNNNRNEIKLRLLNVPKTKPANNMDTTNNALRVLANSPSDDKVMLLVPTTLKSTNSSSDITNLPTATSNAQE